MLFRKKYFDFALSWKKYFGFRLWKKNPLVFYRKKILRKKKKKKKKKTALTPPPPPPPHSSKIKCSVPNSVYKWFGKMRWQFVQASPIKL